mmetsp:Transcript_11966/g.22831  ORF Transcript_11966/g.22831 Transcript_11966/m.22831 type:complete len:208 (+) Transcript_11966:253-876(+)
MLKGPNHPEAQIPPCRGQAAEEVGFLAIGRIKLAAEIAGLGLAWQGMEADLAPAGDEAVKAVEAVEAVLLAASAALLLAGSSASGWEQPTWSTAEGPLPRGEEEQQVLGAASAVASPSSTASSCQPVWRAGVAHHLMHCQAGAAAAAVAAEGALAWLDGCECATEAAGAQTLASWTAALAPGSSAELRCSAVKAVAPAAVETAAAGE